MFITSSVLIRPLKAAFDNLFMKLTAVGDISLLFSLQEVGFIAVIKTGFIGVFFFSKCLTVQGFIHSNGLVIS